MHDPLTHIPLIIRGPQKDGAYQRGHVVNELVELYDVMATCLELAGVQPRHTHFARSLIPQLKGEAGDPARAAFCEAGYNKNEPQCFEPLDQFSSPENPYYPKVALQNEQPETVTRSSMIRTNRYKLIYRPDDQSELYDLTNDPRELHNVWGHASYRKAQEELFEHLAIWYVRTSDIAPSNETRAAFRANRAVRERRVPNSRRAESRKAAGATLRQDCFSDKKSAPPCSLWRPGSRCPPASPRSSLSMQDRA